MADDEVTAALEEIKRRHWQHVCENHPEPGICVSRDGNWPCAAARTVAAVEAALKLTDEWEADIAELVRDIARERKSPHASDHAQAHTDEAVAAELRQCANGVREAITAELTGVREATESEMRDWHPMLSPGDTGKEAGDG